MIERIGRALDDRNVEPLKQIGDAGMPDGGAREGAGAGAVATGVSACPQQEHGQAKITTAPAIQPSSSLREKIGSSLMLPGFPAVSGSAH